MPIDIDLTRFTRAVREVPEALMTGAKRGLHDVLDDWQLQARDKAPLDKGTLRRNIETDVESTAKELSGKISANVYENGFNYGYYIHEVRGKDFVGRKPGTIGEFLDQPARDNADKWGGRIESEIEAELKRKGW